MTWFALALGSAVAAAFTDLWAKRALRSLPVPLVAWGRFAVPLPLLAAAAAVLGWAPPSPGFWKAFAFAIPLEVLAALLYQKALQLSPLGLTAPYLAFTPAFLVVTGRWILGEVASPLACGGIALVTLGGYAVQLSPGAGWLGPLRALARERGSGLMIIVAALFSVTAAVGKLAVLASGPQTYALLFYGALSAVMGPGALRSARGHPRRSLLFLVPVGIFNAAMILCHLSAIRLAPASYMIAVKRSSLLWSILLGGLILGEGRLRERLLGGVLMMAGVALLAVSR